MLILSYLLDRVYILVYICYEFIYDYIIILGTSAICYALITPDGDRSFGLDFGITKQFSKNDIFIPLIEESHFLHFSGINNIFIIY